MFLIVKNLVIGLHYRDQNLSGTAYDSDHTVYGPPGLYLCRTCCFIY